MNLVPANNIMGVVRGDIAMLPSASSWLPLVVDDGTDVHMSQGDMSLCFLSILYSPRMGTIFLLQLCCEGI